MAAAAISRELVYEEMKSTKLVLEKWMRRLEETGFPEVDMPAAEGRLDEFLREFCGEMLVCAGKCENLASVLSGVA